MLQVGAGRRKCKEASEIHILSTVILKVILNVIKLKKNLLVRKMEAARGMLKQPKSRSETERLIMKMAVVFLTWKMMEML